MTKQEILLEMLSLPVEERAFLADTLFKSLNQPDPTIDQAWLAVAQERWAEIKLKQIKTVSKDEVFAQIRSRLAY